MFSSTTALSHWPRFKDHGNLGAQVLCCLRGTVRWVDRGAEEAWGISSRLPAIPMVKVAHPNCEGAGPARTRWENGRKSE